MSSTLTNMPAPVTGFSIPYYRGDIPSGFNPRYNASLVSNKLVLVYAKHDITSRSPTEPKKQNV